MRTYTAAAFLAALLMSGAALAGDAAPPETPAGYVRTGDTAHCLRLARIDRMKILNSRQILVEMANGEAWLQEPRSCSPLRRDYAFAYSSVAGELCDTTSITLLDSGPGLSFSGICIFDEFQKLDQKSAAAE